MENVQNNMHGLKYADDKWFLKCMMECKREAYDHEIIYENLHLSLTFDETWFMQIIQSPCKKAYFIEYFFL